MGRIQVLSDDLANKIAAGEVVERPASVVKELLENSLDAGATDIRIDAEAGGRRLLRVVDNGTGMLRDDALLAFERHATSKLRVTKDLFAISTLGFRGEALPSIASVSRLTLETRSEEEEVGSVVELAGGKIVRYEDAALPRGTSITVRDLFYNVPARRKFLRSEQTELAHIASLATHYSLAQPEIAFELRHNNTELLRVTPVAELRERVYQVFGASVLDELIDLGDIGREVPGEQGDAPIFYRIRGFVSRPQIQKSNRNSIYLFVNRRLIRDRTLLHALSAAYYNLMPGNAFPFALLFLECSHEEVDVNVHPSKTEVRFKRGSFVHDYVRDTIRDTLTRNRPGSSLPLRESPQPAVILPYSEFTQQLDETRADEPEQLTPEQVAQLPELVLQPPAGPAPRLDFGTSAIAVGAGEAPLRLRVPDTHGSFPNAALLDLPASLDSLRDLRPLGQLQDSFIIAAGRDGLWIVDQHVAHERILFERVLRDQAAGRTESQALLLPLVVQLTASQWIEYERIAVELGSMGFETEPFGNRSVAVKAVPAAVGHADVEKVMFEILEIAESELRRVTLADLRRGMAASIACRAAIKINMRLEPTKIDWLLAELGKCEHPMSCPHGRPIALRYGIRDILKGFHRIS